MPPLGAILDMRDDFRGQMELSSNIGRGIGQFIQQRKQKQEDDRIKQEEERQRVSDQLVVETTLRGIREGLSPADILSLYEGIPDIAQSRMAMAMTERVMEDRFRQSDPAYNKNPAPTVRTDGTGRAFQYDQGTKSWSAVPGMNPRPTKDRTRSDVIKEIGTVQGIIDKLTDEFGDVAESDQPHVEQLRTTLSSLIDELRPAQTMGQMSPNIAQEMTGVSQDKRMLTDQIFARFIDDAKRRLPNAGQEQLAFEAMDMAQRHGWIIPTGQVQTEVNPEATQGQQQSDSGMTSEDKQALEWAKQNPNDPRAKKILQLIGR